MDILQKNIISQFGLDKLPEKEREAALERAGQAVFRSVLLRALDEMSEEDKDALDSALEKDPDNPDAMFNFLEQKVPDLQKIISEEILSFQNRAREVASLL